MRCWLRGRRRRKTHAGRCVETDIGSFMHDFCLSICICLYMSVYFVVFAHKYKYTDCLAKQQSRHGSLVLAYHLASPPASASSACALEAKDFVAAAAFGQVCGTYTEFFLRCWLCASYFCFARKVWIPVLLLGVQIFLRFLSLQPRLYGSLPVRVRPGYFCQSAASG